MNRQQTEMTEIAETDNQQPLIYLVSPYLPQARAVKSLLDLEFSTTVSCHIDLTVQAIVDLIHDRNCLYLLDCQHGDLSTIESHLKIGSQEIPEFILIALYNVDQDSQLAKLVRRYTIRGIFQQDDSKAVFIKGIRTILDGHLWLTRKMLSDCVRLKKEQVNGSPADSLSLLTGREKEILRHLIYMESNQEIAENMQISLHTVKSHLYNAYKKIDVPNRMQATLWAAAHLEN